jgi:hypothetical protein
VVPSTVGDSLAIGGAAKAAVSVGSIDVRELAASKVVTNVPGVPSGPDVGPKLPKGVHVVERVAFGAAGDGTGIWVGSDGVLRMDGEASRACFDGVTQWESALWKRKVPPTGTRYVGRVGEWAPVYCEVEVTRSDGGWFELSERGSVVRSGREELPAGVEVVKRFGFRWRELLRSDGRVELNSICAPSVPEGGPCVAKGAVTQKKYVDGFTTKGGQVVLLGIDGKVKSYRHEYSGVDHEYGDYVGWTKAPLVPPWEFEIPPLKKGIKYTAMGYNGGRTVVLARSDGKVVVVNSAISRLGWDDFQAKAASRIPRAPKGLSYVRVVVSQWSVMLLRSDGVVKGVRFRSAASSASVKIPKLARGEVFTDIWPAPGGFYFGVAKVPAGGKLPAKS